MIDGQWADFGERLLILAALDMSSWYLEWKTGGNRGWLDFTWRGYWLSMDSGNWIELITSSESVIDAFHFLVSTSTSIHFFSAGNFGEYRKEICINFSSDFIKIGSGDRCDRGNQLPKEMRRGRRSSSRRLMPAICAIVVCHPWANEAKFGGSQVCKRQKYNVTVHK